MRIGLIGSAVLGALGAVTTAGAGGVSCGLIPNGSFEEGIGDWTFHVIQDDEGAAGASADYGVIDATDFGGGHDAHELALSLYVSAGTGIGSAEAEIVAERPIVVDGSTLRFRPGGGFEFLYFGTAAYALETVARVVAEDGDVAEFVTNDYEVTGAPGCVPALSVLGTYEGTFIEIDLAGAGIEVGDAATLELRIRASGDSLTCQSVEVFAFYLVDRFQFCTDPSDPADLDGDGDVDFADLLQLLTSWGACAGCPADLDGSGDVAFPDLLALLSAWTG